MIVGPRIHPDAERRMIRNDGLALHFSGGDGEFLKFDCRADLRRILCSTLVMAGDRDPITPMTFSETIVANLPEHLVRFERFPGSGHGPTDDDPVHAFAVIGERKIQGQTAVACSDERSDTIFYLPAPGGA